MLDASLIRALHVEALRHEAMPAETAAHVLFQVSTIEALLDGAYDGDLTVGEIAARGDFGLGTFDALDGELIALDGVVHRAAEDGATAPADPARRSPFAVVTRFTPSVEHALPGPLAFDALLALLGSDEPPEICSAVRVDGRFDAVHLRSVPAQRRPYRPLIEVLRDQRTFTLDDVEGSLVGFRYPDRLEGIGMAAHHLHFITADRRRGGHVLSCSARVGVARIDHEADLHVELPPGVELGARGHSGAARDALRRAESDPPA
jgi:acetolactate decarboxylase